MCNSVDTRTCIGTYIHMVHVIYMPTCRQLHVCIYMHWFKIFMCELKRKQSMQQVSSSVIVQRHRRRHMRLLMKSKKKKNNNCHWIISQHSNQTQWVWDPAAISNFLCMNVCALVCLYMCMLGVKAISILMFGYLVAPTAVEQWSCSAILSVACACVGGGV